MNNMCVVCVRERVELLFQLAHSRINTTHICVIITNYVLCTDIHSIWFTFCGVRSTNRGRGYLCAQHRCPIYIIMFTCGLFAKKKKKYILNGNRTIQMNTNDFDEYNAHSRIYSYWWANTVQPPNILRLDKRPNWLLMELPSKFGEQKITKNQRMGRNHLRISKTNETNAKIIDFFLLFANTKRTMATTAAAVAARKITCARNIERKMWTRNVQISDLKLNRFALNKMRFGGTFFCINSILVVQRECSFSFVIFVLLNFNFINVDHILEIVCHHSFNDVRCRRR